MDTRSQPHLLLIDDNLEELGVLVSLLRASGFRISQANTAQQGYQRAIALLPDLIILDLFMPKMDGFAVCRLLSKIPNFRLPPIIFLSSSCSLDDRLQGFALGAVDFVSKPFAPEEVVARAKTHLRLYRASSTQPAQSILPSTDQETLILDTSVQFINQHLSDPPPLAEIARSVGTHEKRLLQIFRKHMGTTVFAFIREARLQKACDLLANDMISIENIAAAVGFSSAANFATAFKTHKGITPREYRSRLRQKAHKTAD